MNERRERSEQAPGVKRRVKIELWRLVLPVLWIGMVGAISFIEAPLKFQAPGITIPLGLGIGRLVFAALNICEGLILLALTLIMFWPRSARVVRSRVWWWGALVIAYVVKIVLVRPPLNLRTDLVLQGADPGQSAWHYIYIALDVATLALLVVLAVQAARSLVGVAARGTFGSFQHPQKNQ